MPSAPLKPCAYGGCSNLVKCGYCEIHSKLKNDRSNYRSSSFGSGISQSKDRKKELDIQRLYNTAWEKRRAAWLSKYPWCEDCLDKGIYTPASEVHHVIPHHGDAEIFVSSPLMSLCRSCHTKHTNDETRGVPPYYPSITRPLLVPVIMVCGAPGSGKNTYVSEHKEEEDLVIDQDQILSEMTGRPMYYPFSMNIVKTSWQKRNLILKSLENYDEKIRTAWFIIGAGKSTDRRIWKELLKPKEVIILLTDKDECIRRIRSDPSRAMVADDQIKAIERWFAYYQKSPGEKIIN